MRYSRACGYYQDLLHRGLLLTRKLLNQGFTLVKIITLKVLRSPPRLGWPYGISVTNDHEYVPLVVGTFRFFPHSWLVTAFVTRVTRRVSQVEQELLNLPEHLISPPVFIGVHVARSLVFLCNVFKIVTCPFFFWPLIVLSVVLRFTDSDYPFGILKLLTYRTLLTNDFAQCKTYRGLVFSIAIAYSLSQFFYIQ